QRNVVPGIIATVTDDKENTVYLDLELEPEENAHAFSSYPAEDIPPGLATTVTKKHTDILSDVRRNIRHYRNEIVVSACIILVGLLAGIAIYLMYSMPSDTQKTPAPVKQPQPFETPVTQSQPSPLGNAENLSSPHSTIAPGEITTTEKKTHVPETPSSPPPPQPVADIQQKTRHKTAQDHTSVSVEPKKIQQTEITSEPSHPTKESADYYLYAGHSCEAKNDLAGALKWYKKALAFDQNDVRLLNKITCILLKMSLLDEAAFYAEKSLKVKKDYIPALVNAAIIYARQGKAEDASRFFEQAITIDNTHIDALYNAMLFYKQQGDYKRASEVEQKLSALGGSKR
ncbi:MAG: hypothetical protein N3B18_11570, partial [Desulfobacterota bacterium]|nr:hypothetical protein [Thermodesulfobacteriota bacterium]